MEPVFCYIKQGYLVYIALCFLLMKLCGKATAGYGIVQWNGSVVFSFYGSWTKQ